MIKSAAATLTFKRMGETSEAHKIALHSLLKEGQTWWTATQDCQPNDWSIRCVFTQDAQPDDTIKAQISFLMDGADYLLKPGCKFKLFPGATKCEWMVEVIP